MRCWCVEKNRDKKMLEMKNVTKNVTKYDETWDVFHMKKHWYVLKKKNGDEKCNSVV